MITMKNIFISLILLIPALNLNAQDIGELAPPKKPMTFPSNALGLDVMVGESGFGLGGFYRHHLSGNFTFFTDFSFSEAKDEREIEYYDYFGNPFVIGKKNRIFQVPINFGVQYRLFENQLTDNLRPYINLGIGPALVFTTPYAKEYFSAFGDAKLKVAAGGYIGFGANLGIDQSSLIGLNMRYYYIKFFDNGVEGLVGRFKDKLQGFFVTLNIGFMY
jgi:hypothetical protein